MRVISGSARGLKLNTPSDDRVRPTTDRVKESMFNIIQDRVTTVRFLTCLQVVEPWALRPCQGEPARQYFVIIVSIVSR